MISFISAGIGAVLILIFDQLTKYYIVSNFSLGESTEFLKGFIDIVYIHNEGAAWGMLSGKTWLLVLFTALAMALCIFYLWKYGKNSKLMLTGLTLVVSGGIGNLIDRVFRDGKVVDFLHFEFWPTFPVFNVADIFITCGCAALLVSLIFFNKEFWKEDKK